MPFIELKQPLDKKLYLIEKLKEIKILNIFILYIMK